MITAEKKIADHGSMLIYDFDWQYPAITEQHAFHKSLKLLPAVKNVLYFAFPWATMIDLLMRNQPANHLLELLRESQVQVAEYKYVITVCQHIHMLKFQHIFEQTGVTHVFWTHAVRGQECFPEYKNIQIFPFPLYPFHTPETSQDLGGKRKHIFSFIGAKANQWYLTESRNHIIDYLSNDSRGLVIAREKWHFNKIVYGHQIDRKYDNDKKENLIDQKTSVEYAKTLRESIFSICPSGTGPNSIRLWESIAYGAIPVILADTYRHPGNETLWEEATVSCPENLNDILALPDRLESLARDENLMKRKRHAMRQLWLLYGPDCFIYDIQKLFLSLAIETSGEIDNFPLFSYSKLLRIASEINREKTSNDPMLNIFILGCSSRILADPTIFLSHFKQNDEIRKAYQKAIAARGNKCSETMSKVLDHRNLNLENLTAGDFREENLPLWQTR